MRLPAPTASQTSSTSRCWQIDFEPTRSRSLRASSSTTGTRQRASNSAVVCPTGPLPSTTTVFMAPPARRSKA
jgi:hypothetical protein